MLTGSCFQYWARKGVSDVNLSETEEEDEKRVSLKKKKGGHILSTSLRRLKSQLLWLRRLERRGTMDLTL